MPKIGFFSILVQVGPVVLVLICAVLSIDYGAIGALFHTKVKHLLVYSGIGHMGFIILQLTYSLLFNMCSPVQQFMAVTSTESRHGQDGCRIKRMLWIDKKQTVCSNYFVLVPGHNQELETPPGTGKKLM